MSNPQIEVTPVRDGQMPFVLIVSVFTVAFLVVMMAGLIGYIRGQELRCQMRPVDMTELAKDWFKGGFGE